MALFTRTKTAAGKPSSTGAVVPGDADLERRIRAIGTELLQSARRERSGILSKAFWSGKLIDWALKDEAFKVQLFRFVDAFPALRSPEEIHDHLADYLSQPGVS